MLGLDKLVESAVDQALSEVFGTGGTSFSEWATLRRAIPKALATAHTQFVERYQRFDPQLVAHLHDTDPVSSSRELQKALTLIFRRPFDDPDATIALLTEKFRVALPLTIESTRIDAAVRAYWAILEREVMYIPQLQQLYSLGYQRSAADQARQLTEHTARMAEGIAALRNEFRSRLPLLAATLPVSLEHRPRHNLPQRPYTMFVGRDEQRAQLQKQLLPHPQSRVFLMTIDGIGGVGKSTLALEVAYTYVEQYATLPPEQRFEVIIWVSAKQTALTADGIQNRRSTFGSLDDLFREISIVLDQPALMHADLDERRSLVERALHAQRMLLIVDNLETVDDETLLTFLRELPEPTKAIVTTRHRIDMAYAIRLLGMPRGDALTLIAIASADRPLALTPAQCEELVERTGGVPLAIVWSIGRMHAGYSIESILRRLGSGQGDIARFCFSESASHLRGRSSEQLLAALALFESPVTRTMLGTVAGLGDDLFGRDEGIAELIQLSLINQSGEWFSLLPLTRSYALDQLQAESERERVLRGHWIAALTTLAQPYQAVHFAQPSPAALIKEGEHLLTLTRWAEQQNRPDIALRVAPAALCYLDTIGDWGTLVTLSTQWITYATLLRLEHEHVQLLYSLAWVQSQQGEYDTAAETLTTALAKARSSSDVAWQIELVGMLSQNARRKGDIAAAEQYARTAYAMLSDLSGDTRRYAQAEIDYELGKIARDQGAWHEAQQWFEQVLTVFPVDNMQPRFNPERSWGILGNLGLVLHRQGRLTDADALYVRALAFFRESGGRAYTSTILVRRAELLLDRGDVAAARSHAHEGLELATRLGMIKEIGQAQELLARCSAEDIHE